MPAQLLFFYYSTILSFANLSNNCFCPNSLKKIVAFTSGLFPSRLITLPNPKRSCSTSIPTCRPDVSDGAKSALGLCALGKIEVVFTTFGFGFENTSPPVLFSLRCHCTLSEPKSSSIIAPPRGLKSRSRQLGFNSSKNLLGSRLFKVPQRYRDVAYEVCNFFSARVTA